jgi:hypothetical protein
MILNLYSFPKIIISSKIFYLILNIIKFDEKNYIFINKIDKLYFCNYKF